MTEQNEKKHLSKTIDYDRDIAPYQFIKIYAGVGSGKNGFVDRLIKGDYFRHADGTLVGKKHILLITSRRSKVNEQLNLEEVVYDPAIGVFDSPEMNWLMDDPKYEHYYESDRMTLTNPYGWGERQIYRRSCVNTNAKIEWNLRMNFQEQTIESHVWERFDMIVIDEVHAVLSDAFYQSAPFYVRRLIEETLKRSDKCKVIVMTGTPEVLERYSLFDDAHLIDRMDECINVRPQAIEFITQKEAQEMQEKMILQGQKFVAFYNVIDNVMKLNAKYPEATAISFSEAKRREQLRASAKKRFDRMVEVELHVAEKKRLPDDLIAFLSTSKNKEGINIENEDIPVMFVEAHAQDDVLQMAGRIRKPIERLYVVVNSTPHPDRESFLEAEFSKRIDTVETVNRFFQEKCQQYGYPLFDDEAWVKPVHCVAETGKVIDFIHAKFPYIRFDYFTQRFVYYPEREISKAYYKEQSLLFDRAMESEAGLHELAEQWYPGIECTVSKKVTSLMWGHNKQKVDQYLMENHWLNGEREIRQDEKQKILTDIMQLLMIVEPRPSLAPLLKKYKYKMINQTKSKNAMAPVRIEAIV